MSSITIRELDTPSLACQLRDQRPWDSEEFVVEGGPKTMLMRTEQALLCWLTSDWYTGAGAIVDAGCFLGGSTYALATGLDRNSSLQGDHTIHSFDLFRVEGDSWEGNSLSSMYGLKAGESFLPVFWKGLDRWKNRIQVHAGDLLDHRWNSQDIEVLFVDIAKSPELHDHAMRQWFTRLIPGRSILVQQDYGWSYYPWGNIAMDVLRDRFAVLGDVPGASRVYLCIDEISDSDVDLACYSNLWPEDKFAAMESALNSVRNTSYEPHLLMNLALVAAEIKRTDVAAATVHELQTRFEDSVAASLARERWPQWTTIGRSNPPSPPPVSPPPIVEYRSHSSSISSALRRLKRKLFTPQGQSATVATETENQGSQSSPVGSSEDVVQVAECQPSFGNSCDGSLTNAIHRRGWEAKTEFDPVWKQRITAMARWVEPGIVADFGCGMMWLEPLLPAGCTYLPIDMVRRDDRTHVIDLNARELRLPPCNTAFFSGCFEYVDNLSRLIEAIDHAGARQIVASYCTRERFPSLELRRTLTWRSDYRLHDLIVKLLRFGCVDQLDEVNGNTIVSIKKRAENAVNRSDK